MKHILMASTKMSKEQELLVVNKIQENGYNIRTVVNDTEPYTLYCTKDIGKILGLRQIHNTVKHFDESEKIMQRYITNGGSQKMMFFTYKGLLHTICLSRQPITKHFAKDVGINIYQTKFNCIEVDTLQHIKSSFENEKTIYQYKVDKYKIDLYFPRNKLAIECDEDHHRLQKQEDIDRELQIKKLIPEIHFIRYKPNDKSFDIFEVINRIHTFIVHKRVKLQLVSLDISNLMKSHKQTYSIPSSNSTSIHSNASCLQ